MDKNTNRHQSRVATINILYQVFLLDSRKSEYSLEDLLAEYDNDSFVYQLITNIISRKEELFNLGNKYLNNWQMSRLAYPDQAILCLGIYEILYTETSPQIVIDEALNLASSYSDEQVKNMINAVLDAVYHKETKNE